MGIFNKKKAKSSTSGDNIEHKNGNEVENKTEQEKAFAYMDVRKIEDPSKRIPLMIKYAEAGVPLALYEIGEMYLLGKDIECNIEKGKEFLYKAGKQGASGAITTLAHFHICEAFYEVSKEKVEQYGQEACMERFSEKYDTGVTFLAWALSKGNISAIDTYTGAVSLGWNEGSFGETLKRATKVAFEPYRDSLLEEATDTAFYILGILSLRGIAMPQDVVLAREFLEKSALLGNEQAKTELNNPLLSLMEDEDDE